MSYITKEECKALADDIRVYADFIETRGMLLPYLPRISEWFYLTQTDYKFNQDTQKYESSLNEEATKEALRNFMAALGPCDKDMTGSDEITVTKKFGTTGDVKITGTISKALTCKKVVTGTRVRPARPAVPEEIVEEYEYVCEDVSLLKLLK